MLASVPSATLIGVQGRAISVEVHVSAGSSLRGRRSARRILPGGEGSGPGRDPVERVGMAPAEGDGQSGSDRRAQEAAPASTSRWPWPCWQPTARSRRGRHQRVVFLGELGLGRHIRRVAGVLPLVDVLGDGPVVVPASCAREAALVRRSSVRCAPSLRSLVAILRGEEGWPRIDDEATPVEEPTGPDLAEIRGQTLGRLAVEVAAAGGHHLLLVGPPGAGKTMLAERLPGLLPRLDVTQALEVTRIHSAAGLPLPPGTLVRRPPLRTPHHSASLVSLIGGGTALMRPGELSCAHHGVLFLDELGEFPSDVLDALRQPLEEGRVLVCRARASVVFPARVLLVAAMNPCPCGRDGGPGSCRCREPARARYAVARVGAAPRSLRSPGDRRSAGCRRAAGGEWGRAVRGGEQRGRRQTGGGRPAADLGPWGGVQCRAACVPFGRDGPVGAGGPGAYSRSASAKGVCRRGAFTGSGGWPAPSPISTGGPAR